ncbi:MAG: SIS domain-containing protein [Spirochaetes bacterium]|nr:SIS domain-containing protein [Spirochaetota bacterium]NLJ05227.1 SIS domain-containing protein [Exilispira sp.]MBP8990930.1 SIS domain-containing protein [Spirochaetota bacterium]HNV43493.1 SIS domain-containing protein [Exilispira sp.]HOV46174.1 SIS domain-containing protein [Exilispira sp.]
MENKDIFISSFEKHCDSFIKMKDDSTFVDKMLFIIEICQKTIKANSTIFFAGNGGSAADAQHAAAELMVRFYKNRKPVKSVSLTTDTSILTAISNDFGYEHIFSRQLEGLGKENDLLIAISTSGNSPSIINLLEKARQMHIVSVGLTGENGGKMRSLCDYPLFFPSDDTPRIQEMHGFFIHFLCQCIEQNL